MKLSQPICILAVAGGLGSLYLCAADKPRFQVNVNMVQLRVTITDPHGGYIENLGRKDFRVLENGVERTISSVISPEQGEKRRPRYSCYSIRDHVLCSAGKR